MSIIYDRVDESDPIHRMAQEIIDAHHPDLNKAMNGIRLCIFLCSNKEESTEPPLKIRGYPCAAIVSVVPYKQRADKRADAEIAIDREQWEGFGDRQQRALLDHEITHIDIQCDENGFVQTDDVGRPKLKLKLHDWTLGGFRSIAKRYGADAIEVLEAQAFQKNYGEDVLQKSDELFAAT